MNKQIIDKQLEYSVNQEKLSCLLDLAAYMMGRINCECLPDNEEIKNNYPAWLESLLDTLSDLAKKQNTEFDSLMSNTK